MIEETWNSCDFLVKVQDNFNSNSIYKNEINDLFKRSKHI